MAFTVTATTIGSLVGDSIMEGATAVDAIYKNGLLTGIRSHYVSAPSAQAYTPTSGALPAPSNFPRWRPNGSGGRAVGDISANPMAVTLAGSTHVICELGINDAQAINAATLTLVQFETNVRTCLDNWRTGGVNSVLWVGPLCSGEHWPSPHGSNNYDTHVDSVDAKLATVLAEYNTTHGTYAYCSWRDMFDVQAPIINPGNALNGFFTTDSVHPAAALSTGMALLTNAILAKVSYA